MSTRLDLISTRISLAALWRELVGGAYRISATLFTPQDCTLVLSSSDRVSGGERQVLGVKHVEILERALLACPKKVIASDLFCSQSSIAAALQRCFSFMGLSCTPSQVPLPVVIAAYANRSRSAEPISRELSLPSAPPREKVVQLRRPECDLTGLLPPAEDAIVRLLAEGKSYREMASARLTSVRTIANQVASVFRRLGVSGRPELLCLLAERALLPSATLPLPLQKAGHSSSPWQRLTIASSAELK